MRSGYFNAPHSQFKYDFTQNTKREIASYAGSKKSKIKDSFDTKKYDNVRMQLKMIEKLKNIIVSN
jgi:hypothetical protein